MKKQPDWKGPFYVAKNIYNRQSVEFVVQGTHKNFPHEKTVVCRGDRKECLVIRDMFKKRFK